MLAYPPKYPMKFSFSVGLPAVYFMDNSPCVPEADLTVITTSCDVIHFVWIEVDVPDQVSMSIFNHERLLVGPDIPSKNILFSSNSKNLSRVMWVPPIERQISY